MVFNLGGSTHFLYSLLLGGGGGGGGVCTKGQSKCIFQCLVVSTV